jgi:hypothetical protein
LEWTTGNLQEGPQSATLGSDCGAAQINASTLARLRLPQQLRQLRHVGRDPPRDEKESPN